jgi:hypothetical protein
MTADRDSVYDRARGLPRREPFRHYDTYANELEGKVPMSTIAWRRHAPALAVAMALLPFSAQGFTAQNGMQVQLIGQTDIAVDFRSWAADTDYWCAAGDFAARVLRVSNATRLYRASPKPRGQGQGIIFTLEPARKADGAGLSSFGAAGSDGSSSVGHAVGAYCRVLKPFDWF